MMHAFDDDTPGTSVVEAKYAFVWSGLQFGRIGVTTGPGRAGWYAPWDSSEGLDQAQWTTKYAGSWADPGWAAMGWRNSSATVGYFPATGYRINNAGAPVFVTATGSVWSSSRYRVANPQGISISRVTATDFDATITAQRANGIPLRCVQGFTRSFSESPRK